MADENQPAKKTTAYSNVSKAEPTPEKETADKPKLARVTSTDPIVKKTPLGRKIAGAFKGDDVKSVGNYILMDVIVPQAKAAITDAVSTGIERLLFGDSRRSTASSIRPGYTAYNRMATSTSGAVRPAETRTLAPRARASHDEVILVNRGEAEIVLDTLREQIDLYNSATVSDLYELVGITGKFTDNKWGWQDLREAGIRRVSNGFLVDLPAPIQLP